MASRDRVTIDLCGIGDTVRTTTSARGTTVAVFARQALIASLPNGAAALLPVSIDMLGRLVLEVFHVTPKQLLMKKRIDKACQLLEETSQSITEVAGACGYADHSAFTRQFKAATHITPALYRVTHKAVKPAGQKTEASLARQVSAICRRRWWQTF